MKVNYLYTLIFNKIYKSNIRNLEKEIDVNTRLIGSSSIFDSIELVTFIVDVEQHLDEKFNMQIQLASDRAMSRRTSPFISIRTLTDYIFEIVNE